MRHSYDVSVVTSGHDVADARLHRHVQALMARDLSVEVLGLGDADDAPACTSVRTWPRPGMAGRARLAARMAAFAGGRVVITLDPDSTVAAGAAVMVSGRVLVVDVHEDYAALLRDRPWARRAAGATGMIASGLVRAFMKAASRAELTVVADDHVPPKQARKRLVVRNQPVPALLPEPVDPEPAPRAVYVGDVRESRGLFAMVEALRLAPEWSLDVVGPVAATDRERLDGLLVAEPETATRIRFHGRLTPAASWDVGSGAWAGLALLHDTPAFREALPSKIGEYLACGLPVISTDLPRQREMLADTAAGVLVPLGEAVDNSHAGSGDANLTDRDTHTEQAKAAKGAARAGADQNDARVDARVGAAVADVLNAWAADPTAHRAAREAALAESKRLRAARTDYDDFADEVVKLLQVQ